LIGFFCECATASPPPVVIVTTVSASAAATAPVWTLVERIDWATEMRRIERRFPLARTESKHERHLRWTREAVARLRPRASRPARAPRGWTLPRHWLVRFRPNRVGWALGGGWRVSV